MLGIKTPEAGGAAHFVPRYVQRMGIEIVPVPVYFPEVTEILGERVYRTVAAVPGEAFGSPGYLRFSYALGDDDLVEGISRLQKLFA